MGMNEENSLKLGTVLKAKNTYVIEKVLGVGGCGITYLAKISPKVAGVDDSVAIKEYFPGALCVRQGTKVVCVRSPEIMKEFRDKFKKEIERIDQIPHPNVVQTIELFEANQTVYYTMEYASGGSLEQFSQPIPESQALGYISPIAEAIGLLHQHSINHLDIKPDNIVLRNNGAPVIIDFGIARGFDENGRQTSVASSGATSVGYAPLEQYGTGIKTFSPEADIYALGATLYRLLTGKTPPEAKDVLTMGLPPMPSMISMKTQSAIRYAMQPMAKDRPANIAEFLAVLSGTSAGPGFAPAANNGATRFDTGGQTMFESSQGPLTNVTSRTQQNDPSKTAPNANPPKNNNMRMALIGGAILVAGYLGYQFIGSDKNQRVEADPALTTEVATPSEEVVATGEKAVSSRSSDKMAQGNRAVASQQTETNANRTVVAQEPSVTTTTKTVPVVEASKSVAAEPTPAPAELSASELLSKGLSESKKFRYESAATYLDRAVKKGNVEAMYHLGDLYYNGNGVKKSFPTAKKYFTQAANNGYADAQYMLGTMCRNGQGGDKDIDQAKTWLQKAASQGNSKAERMLEKL